MTVTATPTPTASVPVAALGSAAFRERFQSIVANVGQVIKGKPDVVRLCLTALLAGGNVLLEDLPGTGKTMLARALAQSFDAQTARVQCTPDLLPGDITGSAVLDRRTGAFVFRPGPVFTNVLLIDEVNRATPKTQSALLEAMQEHKVTYDGATHPLPRPFTVLATQNPIEQAGTFPLPEAQLDRFLFRLGLGFLDRVADFDVLMVHRDEEPIDSLRSVVSIGDVLEMMAWAQKVEVSRAVGLYIVDLIHASRKEPALVSGVSARASLGLLRAARVYAASQGRDDVLPDDVKALAAPTLAHRMLLTPDAVLEGVDVDVVVARLLGRVQVPLCLPRRSIGDDEVLAAAEEER